MAGSRFYTNPTGVHTSSGITSRFGSDGVTNEAPRSVAQSANATLYSLQHHTQRILNFVDCWLVNIHACYISNK